MSFPNHVKGAARVALGSEWGKRSALKRTYEPDWRSIVLRAQHEAKGQVLREGCTYAATGETQWQVRRSVAGRVDQLDLVANGEVVRTAGPRRMPKRFRPAL
jgi:hypothetical protein